MSQKGFEKLLANLVKEIRLQEKLLELLTEERNSMVTLKTERIHEIRKKKEVLLSEVHIHAGQRTEILSGLGFAIQPKKRSTFRLSDCINTCSDSSLKKQLEDVSSELAACAAAVKKLNLENGDIIRTSLGVVSNTISIINARPTIEDKNYNRDGKVHSHGTKRTHSSAGPVSSFTKSA
jgi:flagellar biosynthesis/type III secretory pathway chaperone